MRVLIAEDELISRKLLQSFLQACGHEVVCAANGAEAWDLYQEAPCPLVVTDWVMPEVDGLELIRRIRAATPPEGAYVYVILLTAKTDKPDVVRGMEAGADDFVSKPFDREELRVRVRAGERIVQL